MLYGMTYEQFWEGDPWMVRAYAEAYILKRRIKNEDAWIQGAYMANAVTIAIANTFGKKRVDYMKEPMQLYPKTEAEKQADIREQRRKVIEYFSNLRLPKGNNTGVDQNGSEP